MKFSLRLLTLLALIILFSYAKAQNENNITLDLKRASFAEFVQNVEKQTNYFFYYNKVDTDSVFITISVQNATIATVLNTVFENTELYFSIADNKKIFVSRNVQLLTNLGTLFFKTNEQVNKKEKTITVIEDSIEETNTNDVAIQNKLIVIGKPNAAVSGKVLITGQVKNGKNNEPIVGAVIAAGKTNVVTDYLGKFTISLNKGRNMLTASSIGMRDAVRQLLVQSSGNINIEMQENITALKGVVVTATKRNTGVKTPKMGVEKITIKQLKQ
ncbi:MAG TPA: carboxypeptidase-like regulatory domain-containing protein, partial [Chitinophagaceae bacterium]|nr:carboxypeptidase-like regulatory domain-containing protein [Chitinophagaceae bacterium]